MSSNIYNIIEWSEFKSLIKQHFNRQFVKIDDLFTDDSIWYSLENYDELDDIEIYNCLDSIKKFKGILYVVTDASYQQNLAPFIIHSNNLKKFVEKHYETFNENFLETDVLIISFELNLAWIFHHEGVYSVIDFSKQY